ncbi:type II toxin-antitoxin system VapC family toxin [Sphingomonas sp. ABOLD]|uniref:Ribonuclease VapC n=4 Tax=Sphingomonadaceae TaxID=41297 RepID=A0A7T3ADY2_SPHPI|nr:type II toxin-antitoxin system VapC family toxin [Sphingomonas paucimobilis]NJB98950.1 tRNA(fMet)-specific endonuclease VapC [Sphingomonas trueperi]RSV51512.1 type II toxin-antitoxin system VapC family toxin [Sphingomonas sp. ABOLD]GAN14597.1 ribonuclease VapC [Sphingomonas paucimobilis NBRC 13935]QPS14817.1 type II toxin-antitoxin system VapC family toxin [Sphingomonas paucimobilis]QPT10894.1 type II toxin-antitoxin system VapC family toxin [Sphingomonas paucimobilis]
MTQLYMLDTNIVSELARNPHGAVATRIAQVGADAICVSIITAAELRYGCAKKGSPRLLAQIEAILGSVSVLALDVPADTEYGGIRAELESAGKPIGPNDLFIAAHAYALGATLVTANIGEFSRVRALKVENWLSDVH